MADDIEYPKFILCMRGTPSPHIPKPGQPMRYGVEMKAFFTLEDFKAYAEKEQLDPNKIVGLYEIGEPLVFSVDKKVTQVEKHEWTINP